MASSDPSYLMWFDFETTGLWNDDGTPPKLMEVAALLLPFGDFDRSHALFEYSLTFHLHADELENLSDYIKDMHGPSGLIDESRQALATPRNAEMDLLELLHANGVERKDVGMAGSGISSFDVPLAREYMPELYEFCHYAPYDVGTGRRAFRMLWPQVDLRTPEDSSGPFKKHRAMPDVEAHLREAKHYRESFVLVRRDPDLPTMIAPLRQNS